MSVDPLKDSEIVFSQASLDKINRSVYFHSHPGIEMIFVSEGKGEMVVGSEHRVCSAGDLVIIPPETLHNQTCRGHFIVSFIVFVCPQDFFDGSFRILDVSSDPWCAHLFRDICRMSEEKRYELCEGVLHSLLRCITRIEENINTHHDLHPALRKALEIIEKNFRSEISMEQLALDSGASYPYLRKLFAKKYHFSPMRYLQNIRMATARKLLLNSYLSVSDVAAQCGYPDSNYFTRLFRKIHHCSPGEYKRIMHERPPGSFIRM